MKRNGMTIPAGILSAVLALVCILLAPVAALSHQADLPLSSGSVVSSGCAACHDDAGQASQSDDCDTGACCCACHAPLAIAAVAVPLPVAMASSFSVVTPSAPPQVYLPIFVPPQNRS